MAERVCSDQWLCCRHEYKCKREIRLLIQSPLKAAERLLMLTKKKKKVLTTVKKIKFLVSFSEQSTLLGSDRFYTTHSYLSVNVSLLSPLLMGGLTCLRQEFSTRSDLLHLLFTHLRDDKKHEKAEAKLLFLVWFFQSTSLALRGKSRSRYLVCGADQERFSTGVQEPEKAVFNHSSTLRVIKLSVH